MAGQAYNYGTLHTFIAGGAITANTACKLDSTVGQVIATTAIADNVIGIATQTVATGEEIVLQCGSGVKVKLVTSAAVALGAQVMPTAAGAGKVSTAAGATAQSIGIALSATAADGEVAEVLLRISGNGPANS